MICQTCGFEIDDYVLACPQCGRDPAAPCTGPPPASDSFLKRENRSGRAGKSRRIRVIISAALGLCLIGFMMFVLFNYFLRAGEDVVKMTCTMNQQTIEGAISRYGTDNGRWPSSMSDLATYVKQEPFCPLGTRHYIWVNPPGGSAPYIRCPNSKDHKL